MVQGGGVWGSGEGWGLFSRTEGPEPSSANDGFNSWLFDPAEGPEPSSANVGLNSFATTDVSSNHQFINPSMHCHLLNCVVALLGHEPSSACTRTMPFSSSSASSSSSSSSSPSSPSLLFHGS